MRVPGGIALLCGIVLSAFAAHSGSAAEEAGRLASITSGFFYTSVVKGDGVVQLSECRDVKHVGRVSGTKPFVCMRDGKGLRCTADGSLDVIFVFRDRKTCETDRKENLESDEE